MAQIKKTIRSIKKTTTRAAKVRMNSTRQKRRTYHAQLGQPTRTSTAS